MAKYLKTEDGKFAGSVGEGVEAPTMPAADISTILDGPAEGTVTIQMSLAEFHRIFSSEKGDE